MESRFDIFIYIVDLLFYISIVPQDFVHYHFTMRENICISDLSAISDEKRLAQVIEDAGMPKLIENIGGVDVQMGRELSGGEWQKTAIARGLFKDCPLMILDEPTSALDPLVEYEILNRFLELTRDRTTVIISHRVGICRTADRIVVMKDGCAVETGRMRSCWRNRGIMQKSGRSRRSGIRGEGDVGNTHTPCFPGQISIIK